MSKSLKRVTAQLIAAGFEPKVREMPVSTKTAQEAADAMCIDVGQIAKSIIFRGQTSDSAILFITSGTNRVDIAKAQVFAQEPLGRADAAFIRAQTGFAIGGVSPVGHLNPIKAFFDQTLMDFETIWAAAGTPHHMFEIAPATLQEITKSVVGEFSE